MTMNAAVNAILIGVAINLGTTLITLWTGADVKSFSDITPISYAVAIITAAIAGLTQLQARYKESPASPEVLK